MKIFLVLGLFFGMLYPTAAQVNPFIMADPSLSASDRAQFLVGQNPGLDPGFALNFALLYEEECRMEGVNADLAFAQMILETNALRYGGQVRAGQNNFAGLGALDGGAQGLSFPTPREGVRAQIQHLKYYGSTLPLANSPVNPRLPLIRRGSALNAWQLSKAWASDPDYGKKILDLMNRMAAPKPASAAVRKTFAPGAGSASL